MHEGYAEWNPATLESVLNTADLEKRASHPPDYRTENGALLTLARHLSEDPSSGLQKLAEAAMRACGAASAGVSLLNAPHRDWLWAATVGAWKPYVEVGTLHGSSPCAIVLDRKSPQLFTHPARYYTDYRSVSPPIEEALVVPFQINGRTIGTVWVLSHTDLRFDREHVRLIENLSHLGATAFSLAESLASDERQLQTILKMNEALVLSSVRQHELTESATTAEVLARRSEERLRVLVSVITDIPWTTDASGRFVTPQASWSTYTGQTWDEARDFGWMNALHPDDRERFEVFWREGVQEGVVYRTEGRIWHSDTHRYHYMEARGTPITAENGSLTEWVGACADINEITRAKIKLEVLNEDLRSFTHAASHDLQEPLRTMMIFAELLLQDPKGRDPRTDQFITYIAEGAARMNEMLKGMLAYWTAGRTGSSPPVRIDSNSVLQKALAMLDASMLDSGAIVSHDPLPSVLAEESPLLQLFQNLIGNAIKYRATESHPHIRITSQQHENMCQISIQDDGIGIPADQLNDIFLPFKRLHGREFSGTGLGLSMCRKIVEGYGGQIWAESTVGQGTTFHFTLPMG